MNGSPLFRLVREALAAPVPLGLAAAALVAAGGGQLALTWIAKSWLELPAGPSQAGRPASHLPLAGQDL